MATGKGFAMVQYRKSKKVGPFRVTASTRGISTSVGSGPFRVTRRADGRYQRTVRVPGTGIRDTKIVRNGQRHAPASAPPAASPAFIILQLGKLFPILLVLGLIISVLSGSLAIGLGIAGALYVAVLVGGVASIVVLIRRRAKIGK